MRIGIICFSGTGNTKKIAKEYQRLFEKEGHEVLWQDLEKVKDTSVSSLDLLVLAYPVHAFNAPQPVLRLARRLRSPKRLDAVILKTSGEPMRLNNSSSLKLTSILRHRNIRVRSEYWYVMPYNIIFRHSDGMAWRMWTTAEERIPDDALWVLHGGEHHLRRFPFGRFLTFVMRIEHWGVRLNGRLFKVSPECVRCMRCVRECPMRNISEKDGKLVFHGSCALCMRCVMNCPKGAITIGLLKGWEVTGPYSFRKAEEDKPIRYCKSAYDRYFKGLV